MIEELVTECPNFAFIEYHFNDDYENVYSNARIEYYDVVAYPKSMIDGTWQPDWSNYDAYVEVYDDRMATLTNYSLSIDLQGDGTNFTGSVDVSWLAANNEDKVLHVVLTESNIEESWYGGEEINYVARLMIPDQFGTPLEAGENTNAVFDFEFVLEDGWSKDFCELLAFVQDTITQEIFQAEALLLSEVDIEIYDVALESIEYPVEEHCGDVLAPQIVVKNLCNDYLNSCEIVYEINGEEHAHSWTGNLWPNMTQLVELPAVSFIPQVQNTLQVTVSLPNGEQDQNPDDNGGEVSFEQAPTLVSNKFILELMTDDFASETSWTLLDDAGEIVQQGSGYENNTFYSFEWELTEYECYTFVIEDNGGNGICCDNGAGYFALKDGAGNTFYAGGEFEFDDSKPFFTDQVTKVDSQSSNQHPHVFPNPAHDQIFIRSDHPIHGIELFDIHGTLMHQFQSDAAHLKLDCTSFSSGIYYLKVVTDTGISVQSLLIQ